MPLFDPTRTSRYQAGSNPFIDEFLNTDYEAGLNSIFPQAGGFNPLGNFLRQSLGRYTGAYKGVLPDEPNLGFTDFLRRQKPGEEFANLSPGQRGERPGMFAPRVRWIG